MATAMTHLDHQPHMVMVVNNSLSGDSRVQKSAIAAGEAGFRVTVLGLRINTNESTGTVGPAKVFRAEFDPAHISVWNRTHGRVPLWEFSGEDSPIVSIAHDDIEPVFTLDAKSPIEVDHVPSLNDEQLGTQLGIKAIDSIVHRLGLWARLWPMTWDYINAFVPALIDLDPDVIHCHDYHPMPAVVSYVLYKAQQGKKTPWVYDAHEWLPGQTLSGPEVHKKAWLAVESKLIRAADAVVSVSEVLATKMKQRHKLDVLPTVVTNAPPRQSVPLTGIRTDLRSNIGLAEDVPLLVYVGKLSELRGIYTAAQALELLPDVHIAFVGSNSPMEIAQLNDISKDIGAEDRLHVLEYVPAESVTAYVSTADVGISPLLPTEAHHSALPTKIREYLHSRLPLVVSDMREQSKFVREAGVGEIHTAGDPDDFARAVQLVLTHHTRYRSRITEELLREHSWEKQAERLTDVWGAQLAKAGATVPSKNIEPLSTSSYRPGDKDDKQKMSLAYFSGDPQLDAVAEQWLARNGDVLAIQRPKQRRIETAIAQFEKIKHHVIDLVLYQGGKSVFSGIPGKNFERERLELYQRGIDVAVYTGSSLIVPSQRLAKFDPSHPLVTANAKLRSSTDRRVRLLTENFSHLATPVFTHSFLGAALMPQGTWIPPIVRVDEARRDTKPGDIKVGVLPTVRSPEEDGLIAQTVAELKNRGIAVTEIRGRGLVPESTRQYDVLIDSLHRMDMSEATAHHMANGGVVVGAPPYTYENIPFWEANVENLLERLCELIQDIEQMRQESLKSLAYSRQTFTAENVVGLISKTIRPQL